MDIRAAEISSILKEQIKNFGKEAEVSEIGQVLSVGDGIARVYGLDKVQAGEMVEFPGGIRGMALNLEADNVGVVIFGDDRGIKEGDTVKRTGAIVEVPVGKGLLGRVVDALGNPIDGKGPIKSDKPHARRREGAGHPAAQVGARADGDRPQGHRRADPHRPRPARADHRRPPDRQDRHHPRHLPQPEVAQRRAATRRPSSTASTSPSARSARPWPSSSRCWRRTARSTTRSSSPPPPPIPAPMQYLAPFTGCTMGEYFRDNGMHAVIAYDDLSKQAVAYRQMSLLLRRPPGREAYPGDVFYLHSRLLERAAKLNEDARRGLADRAAGHRDAGQRRVGLHPDQRHLDHRRPDLPRDRPLLSGHPPGGERRPLGVARRLVGADQGDEAGGRPHQGRAGPVPRDGGLRPVRLRSRRRDAAHARRAARASPSC